MAEPKKAPLLKNHEELVKNLDGYLEPDKTLALVLDFEGTLAPLGQDLAAMPKDNELNMKKVVQHPNIFLAIISGRPLDDIKKHLKLENICYAANNGLEVELPDKAKFMIEMPEALLEKYGKLLAELKEKVVVAPAWVEDKKISLTYHYKGVNEKLKEKFKTDAKAIIKSFGFQIIDGYHAIEAKPPLNWDKGEGVKMILEKKFGEDWAKNVKVVYAGDDITDEDVMKALHGVGKTFRVSEQPNLKTFADYQLKKPEEVAHVLQWILHYYPVKKDKNEE